RATPARTVHSPSAARRAAVGTPMRTAVYLLAMLILLPYLALAAGFLALGNAIAGGTLLAFFDALLTTAAWLIPWGLLGFAVAFAALLAAAASERYRRFGAACLCLVALASLAIIVVLASGPLDTGHALFLLPCVLACLGAGWIAATDGHAPPPSRP